MHRITVMLVDDHPVFRQGLRRVLEDEDDLDVIVEVADGLEALRMAKQLVPHVMLLDINLPGMNGLQVARALKDSLLDINIIMLTAYHDDQQVFHAIRAGASAYFPKDVSPRRLIEAIRLVHQGSYVVEDRVLEKPQVGAWLLEQFEGLGLDSDDEMGNLLVPLSPREMEILQFIAQGKSNKEIAFDLGISRQTVKNHMTSILRKLAVNDRTQAAIYALRRGWIRLQDL
ncbi:MAG: response regulator transcription factor [Anaerolineae bacterium]|jgi:DNA-binding NarL/FixJ family response regulator|nr:response regulator transcription factor [Anaerolineae bacterium]MDX9831913.1 response regulator transcription factor [Anaerolineae bacterium]